MNASDNLAHVAALRAQLWDAGFRPVALVTGDKMPRIQNWQERARRDPPVDAVEAPRSDHLNTGILCDGLRVLDLDIDDASLVSRVKAMALDMLGADAPIRTRANSPRCALVYRAADGEPMKRSIAGTLGKIEVLGCGQVLHAFGRHPSGAHLTWHPEPPGQAMLDSLPAATEDQISAFLAAAAPLIGAEIPGPRERHHARPEDREEAHAEGLTDPLDVAAALAIIPNDGPANWEAWNAVAMAVWAATGGSEAGRVALDAWSARNPAYDAEETRQRWEHYTTSPPTRTGAGKLWAMAREAVPGWEPPSKVKRNAEPMAPDMSVLRLTRRPPPALPLDVFGTFWANFMADAAKAAACPVDYVAAPLLASASALIGNARWAQATPGWVEPPHLWMCSVGDSGGGKSPGADVLLRDVLPELEKHMAADFPDRHAEWQRAAEAHRAKFEQWQKSVRDAQTDGKGAVPPLPPDEAPPEPQVPRLRQNDITIEKTASLLASAAPKGLLVTRDELLGFMRGMDSYHSAGRQFWLEAYGGRPYRVERQKHPLPIVVERLAVSLFGGCQPAKLVELMKAPDDGLLARVAWFWPDPTPFDLSDTTPRVGAVVDALDRLRLLDLAPGATPDETARPIMVPMTSEARDLIRDFGSVMQARQTEAGGLMVSTIGKARGLALRLSLVLQYLWWCAEPGYAAPPTEISKQAAGAACMLVEEYLLPMAERVFGDAATTAEERNAAALARWIFKTRTEAVNTRKLQREIRLPGLDTAEAIRAACAALVEACWLTEPRRPGVGGRPSSTYGVNPAVWGTPR